ncbi:unnamed protein product [Amoebophrya sp. A25]|nr:unnamed protein product [Amoebophrya sp. A25]|eukprot:GSA25T00015980001.1
MEFLGKFCVLHVAALFVFLTCEIYSAAGLGLRASSSRYGSKPLAPPAFLRHLPPQAIDVAESSTASATPAATPSSKAATGSRPGRRPGTLQALAPPATTNGIVHVQRPSAGTFSGKKKDRNTVRVRPSTIIDLSTVVIAEEPDYPPGGTSSRGAAASSAHSTGVLPGLDSNHGNKPKHPGGAQQALQREASSRVGSAESGLDQLLLQGQDFTGPSGSRSVSCTNFLGDDEPDPRDRDADPRDRNTTPTTTGGVNTSILSTRRGYKNKHSSSQSSIESLEGIAPGDAHLYASEEDVEDDVGGHAAPEKTTSGVGCCGHSIPPVPSAPAERPSGRMRKLPPLAVSLSVTN